MACAIDFRAFVIALLRMTANGRWSARCDGLRDGTGDNNVAKGPGCRRLLGRGFGFDFADDFAGARGVVQGDEDFAGAVELNSGAGFDVVFAQGHD